VPSTPTYRRIADLYRDQISRGELAPGARIPTEVELQGLHGVSRDTVRKAVGELVSQGLVETRGRHGTFVRTPQVLRYLATVAEEADRPRAGEARDAFFDEVLAQGRQPSQDFSMVIEPAGHDVATRLEVAKQELVVARMCLRLVDDVPWSDQASYYAMDVSQAAGLVTPRDIPQGTVRAMADVGLHEIGRRDELSARMPTPEEANALQIGPGVPVILYYRTTYNEERPLRVTRTLFAADRNTIVYELGDLVAYYQGLRVSVG
jgi:GntR family transcriptional regulator